MLRKCLIMLAALTGLALLPANAFGDGERRPAYSPGRPE